MYDRKLEVFPMEPVSLAEKKGRREKKRRGSSASTISRMLRSPVCAWFHELGWILGWVDNERRDESFARLFNYEPQVFRVIVQTRRPDGGGGATRWNRWKVKNKLLFASRITNDAK